MLYTHGDMGVLLQEFLHPPQVSWAQQDWTEKIYPACSCLQLILFIWFLDSQYICAVSTPFKKLQT